MAINEQVKQQGGGRSQAAGVRQWLGRRYPLKVGRLTHLATFRHLTTHRTIWFQLWHGSATDGGGDGRTVTWRSLAEVDDLPLPNPQIQAVQVLGDGRVDC